MTDNLTISTGLKEMTKQEKLMSNGGHTWYWYLGTGDGPISSDELDRLVLTESTKKKAKMPERFRY